MKFNMYAIYDKKAESYSVPFHALNHDCAKRVVIASLHEDSFLQQYPHDYRLDCIGSFDDSIGFIADEIKQEIVCEVSNFVSSQGIGVGMIGRKTETVQND